MQRLRKLPPLITLLLGLTLIAYAWGQENKNRDGSGNNRRPDKSQPKSAPDPAASTAGEAAPGPTPESARDAARRAREERHRREQPN